MGRKINHLEEQKNEQLSKEYLTFTIADSPQGIYYIASGSPEHSYYHHIDEKEIVLFLNILDKFMPKECVFECADYESLDYIINYLKSIGAKEIKTTRRKIKGSEEGDPPVYMVKGILSKEVIKLLLYRSFSDNIEFGQEIGVSINIRRGKEKEEGYFYIEFCHDFFDIYPKDIIFYIGHDFDYYEIATGSKSIRDKIIKVIKDNAKSRNLNVKIKHIKINQK